jgi:hypothetical protein
MSAHGGPRGRQQNPKTSNNPWAESREQASGPNQEHHVPVGGFNAAEAKAALKRGMISFLACARIIPFANRSVILVQALDVLAQTLDSDSPHVATIEPLTSTHF